MYDIGDHPPAKSFEEAVREQLKPYYTLPTPIVFQSPLEKYEAGIEFLGDLITHENERQKRREECRAAQAAGPTIETLEGRVANVSLRNGRPRPSPEELARRRRVGRSHTLREEKWKLTRRAAELQFRMEDLDTEYKRSLKFCIIWRKHTRAWNKLDKQGHPTAHEEAKEFKQRKSYLLKAAMRSVSRTQGNLDMDMDMDMSD